MNDTMAAPVRYEELTAATVAMLRKSFGGLQAVILGLDDIDIPAGAGVLDGGSKCVWRRDGRRITFWVGSGAQGASVTKEIDPLARVEARA